MKVMPTTSPRFGADFWKQPMETISASTAGRCQRGRPHRTPVGPHPLTPCPLTPCPLTPCPLTPSFYLNFWTPPSDPTPILTPPPFTPSLTPPDPAPF